MDFHFQKFSLRQSRSAMKIGTDGVLLGSWASGEGGSHALDIGTGTGLIALMVVQRFPHLHITGIEPNKAAAEEARENFSRSPWPGKLDILQCKVEEYYPERQFDYIFSNPPFYQTDILPDDPSRSQARNARHLSPETLLKHAGRLLNTTGSFQVILPEATARQFIIQAQSCGLYLHRQLMVRPEEGKPVNRRMMAFGRRRGEIRQDRLSIRENGKFTSQYHSLTAEYYIR